MPIYEYTCDKCNAKFEKLIKSMNSTEAVPCPTCGGKKTSRQFSSFAVGGGGGCCSAAPSCPNRMM